MPAKRLSLRRSLPVMTGGSAPRAVTFNSRVDLSQRCHAWRPSFVGGERAACRGGDGGAHGARTEPEERAGPCHYRVGLQFLRTYPRLPRPYPWLAAAPGQLSRASESRQVIDDAAAVSPTFFAFITGDGPSW